MKLGKQLIKLDQVMKCRISDTAKLVGKELTKERIMEEYEGRL